MVKNILGVSAYYHDSAACLVRDGDIASRRKKTWRQTYGSEVPGWYYGSLHAQLLINDCMNTSSVMLRRKVLEQCGTFDEQFEIGEDYDLWLRIARNYPMVYVDRVCCKYRVREDGLSGAIDVRGVRWLESHLAVGEKYRRAGWIPSEHRELLDHILRQRYWELGWNHFGYNRFREARKCFLEALRARPLRPKIWLYLFSSFLPTSVVESIRELRQHIKKAASTNAQPLR